MPESPSHSAFELLVRENTSLHNQWLADQSKIAGLKADVMILQARLRVAGLPYEVNDPTQPPAWNGESQ